LKYEDHPELIAAAAAENGVDIALIRAVLDLEPEFRNLHAYNNKPRFKRRLQSLVDEALKARRTAPTE